jgi:PKD repeat protein/nitrate reductase cytochrome c-type subunit
MLALPARAEMYQPTATAGGIQVQPVIDGPPVINGTNATMNFHGLQAPYMIQASDGTNWSNAGVTSLRHPNFSGTAFATNVPLGSAQLRLMMLGSTNWAGKWNPGALAISNVFVGANKCNGCHGDKVTEWSGTGHATAISDLMDTNGNFIGHAAGFCVVCHSVGKGQPGGFVDLATTPQLANVQCENCHGSANAHVNISTRQFHPVNTLAAEMCGGCHDGSMHPTFAEWTNSPHAEVTPDVGYGISSGAVFHETVIATVTNVSSGVTSTFTGALNGYVISTNGVTNALAGIVNSTNDVSGNSRQMQCGFCHSGPTRLAMLNDYESRGHGYTNYLALPDKWDAAEYAQTCAVCHDPHSAENEAQLRNPLNSTNYYTLFTGSQTIVTNTSVNVLGQTNQTYSFLNGGFASQYNPDVQICAQCHNSRGARWDGKSKSWNAASNTMVLGTRQSWSRPPHHSPQYNVLIGIVQDDYLNLNASGVAVNYSAAHSGIMNRSPYNTNQCATCHVVSSAVNAGTNITGHTFALDVKGCALGGCHTSSSEAQLHTNIEERQLLTSNNIAAAVALLNQWATNNAPDVLRTNYGTLAWEYQMAGVLGNPTGNPAIVGPTDAKDTNQPASVTNDNLQAKIPDPIKQARFNLYMVQHDGSMGVHNPGFLQFLISDATNKVGATITGAANPAYFIASTTKGYAPFTAAFTSGGSGITSYKWDFGDGGTSTKANPTYTYASRGTNTVTLTTTTATSTNIYSRTNYIGVYAAPVPSFTANVLTGTAPLTVTFTNTSSGTNDVTAWRWTVKSGTNISTNAAVFAYTYTLPGTNNVALRATTAVGNITTTSNAFIIVTP